MKVLKKTIEIEAPIDDVWEVLTSFDKYEAWNRFTPKVETSGRLGDPVTLHVRLKETGNLRKSHLKIEHIEPYTLSWGTRNLFIEAHRTQSLSPLDSGHTLYESKEPFGGLLGRIVVWFLEARLMRGYQWAAEGLKNQAEQNVARKKAQ